jgi:hypothetical protein
VVDMTTHEPIESTARLMGNLLEQMEELLE